MPHAIEVGLIYGSTRPGRFCDTVASWTAGRIEDHGLTATDIDPARHDDDQMTRRLDRAAAFVVVTPEYNHGYPAPLKSLIDARKAVWETKPVGFVSYGGVSGGLRAVEQLRLVFAELHAVTLRDGVSFQWAWERFGDGGLPWIRRPTRRQP